MSGTKREEFLPFHKPWLGAEEIEEVADTLRSGWLTLGPKTARFEQQFAAWTGARHAVAVSSCTAALHLALEALGIGPGDEVITTPYTFTATVAAILYTGATPVLVDTLPEYPNIDPQAVESRLTERTRVILPVHFAGTPCDLDRLMALAETHGVALVEDAAHALPASYRGSRVGTIGRATAFSFYAGKNITTGEGGMLTTDDDRIAEDVRCRRLHGISRDAWKRYTAEGSWYYEVTARGFKYNMTDIQASIGIHQLKRLDEFHARRQALVHFYNELLSEIPAILVPEVPLDVDSAWHLYVIRIDDRRVSCSRGEVIEMLRADNIGASVHFIPIHHHPYYQELLGLHRGDFPNATRYYEGALSLPLFPAMRRDDVRDVAASLERIMKEHRR